MNNTFNFNRFALLLKRQWLEFGKIYLISLAVLAGIIITFYALNLGEDNLKDISDSTLGFRTILFLVVGFLFLTIISSSYFSHLGQKSKAIVDLLIPASTLEKFLTSLFYTCFVAIGSYLLIFYLIDMAFLSVIRKTHTSTFSWTDYRGNTGSGDNLAYFFNVKREPIFRYLYFFPFFFNSLFLLGSIYFNRFHYIKTTVSVMLFAVAWISSIIYILNRVTRDTVWVGGNFWQDDKNETIIIGLAGCLLTMIFWSIAYIRLKEKEV